MDLIKRVALLPVTLPAALVLLGIDKIFFNRTKLNHLPFYLLGIRREEE